MTWIPFKPIPNAASIVKGLKEIPTHWSLTVLEEKSPKRKGWQSGGFIPHVEITQSILHGDKLISSKGKQYTRYSSGFGVRTGEYSGGLVAIDVDGASAQPLLEAISNGDLPITASWTSGKPGRYQIAFQVPDDLRPLLKDFTRRVLTEWGDVSTNKDEEGNPIELLEFRYNRCQSALPPSYHPTTGEYKWIHSPATTPVAIAPQWLCDLLVKFVTENKQQEQQRKQRLVEWEKLRKESNSSGGKITNLVEFLEFEVLPRLTPEKIYSWEGHNFRQFGDVAKGIPPWRQSSSGSSFHVWWDGKQWAWHDKGIQEGGGAVQYRWKLRGGSGTPKGKDYFDIVAELANEAGVQLPEFPKSEALKSEAPNQDVKVSENPEHKKQTPDWAWENWLKSRRFKPDYEIDQSEFSFDNIPDSGIIAAIKSGLGTGKTKYLIRTIKALGRSGVLIGYRNNLLLQTGERGKQSELIIYHLREDGGINLLGDESIHQMLCLDSIHHMDGYFKGRDIFLDETMSVVLHGINGGTLGDGQAKAIRIFTNALEDCNRIFLLDGNLNDLYTDFVAKIAKNKKVIKINNKRKIPAHTIKFIEGVDEEEEIKQRDRSPLIQFMLHPGVIPWIFCDSKQRADVLNKILTDTGKRGILLSSETAGEDWAKKLLADPDSYISETKPDFAIITPTGESGLSVTLQNYFTDKISFFVGVQGTNSQHQAMFRLRDSTIPHYVFCPERSNVRDRANPNTYSEKKFKEILNERIIQSAVLAGQASANSERVLEVIGSAIARQQDDWWEMSCKLGIIDNFEMDNLRKCLIHALEEAGHNVEILQWQINAEVKEVEKAAKESVQRQHSREIYTSVEFPSVEEAREKAKSNPRKETQRRIEKTFLLDRIPGIQLSPVWTEDFIYECHVKNKDFINQQQRYYMVKNFEVSQKRHEASWFYLATGEDFFSARVKKMSHDVIWALKELNITQFIGKEYHKNSLEVINVIKELRERKDVQLALRIYHIKPETSDGKERIKILGDLLKFIGFKNLDTERKFVNNVRLWHYRAEPTTIKPGGVKIIKDDEPEFDLEAARLAILEAIERKFTAWMESDKSKVNWEPKSLFLEEVEVKSPAVASPAEKAANILSSTTRWEDVAELCEEEFKIGWQALTIQEQKRLEKMHESWKRERCTTDDLVVGLNKEFTLTESVKQLRRDWLCDESLKDLADQLQQCESSTELADVRSFAPSFALKSASRLIPDNETRRRITEWVISQNQQKLPFATKAYLAV